MVGRVFFPAPISLSLFSARIYSYDLDRFIGDCPVLQELIIRDGDFNKPTYCRKSVESASIKRLVVFTDLPKYHLHKLVYLRTPSLVYLDYSSYVAKNYDCDDLGLLVEARLSLKLWRSTDDYDYYDDDDIDDDDDGIYDAEYCYVPSISGNITNLVAAVSNITTLHLSPDSLEVFHFCCTSMPVFKNLLKLYIESNKEKGWQVMPLLLKSCPNLHALVIKGLVHKVTNRCGDACICIPKKARRKKDEEVEISCLCTCKVKALEISKYGGSLQELRQISHFLGKLECLETVKVRVDTNYNKFWRVNLLTLRKLSPRCNVQFI